MRTVTILSAPFLVLMAVVVLWPAATAHGQENTADSSRARELDKRAMALFKQGNKDDAVRLWVEAATLLPPEKAARITLNLAVAYESLGELEKAWDAYRRATAIIGKSGNVAARKAKALGKKLAQTHGRLVFSVQPGDAMVEIQPETEGPLRMSCPPVWWLQTGKYSVLVGKQGFQTVRKELQVVAGKDYPVKVELAKTDQTPPADINIVVNGEVHAMPVVLDPGFDRQKRNSPKSTLRWAATGVGAGVAGIGAALHIGTAMREEENSSAPGWWSDGAYVLYGVGAGMAATGILLLIFDEKRTVPVRVDPIASPGNWGASLSVGF